MSVHADQRRRLYLAMLEHPQGITSKDFRTPPAIDGGDEIPRVAARIEELREEHTIPMGVRDPRGYAIYRLASATGPMPVTDITPPRRRVTTADGFVRIAHCLGCLTNHPYGHVCPHGYLIEERLLGHGPTDQPCRHTITTYQEDTRRAA